MCYQKVLQALSEFCYCQHNVWICDTTPQPTARNPNNLVPVHNEDDGIMSPSIGDGDSNILPKATAFLLCIPFRNSH
jgi:hypothetical protein